MDKTASMTLRLFFLITLNFLILSLQAQQRVPNFHHLTRDNGLSSNRVNCIIEDNQGFIWFGTEDGLNKFDGYQLEVFRSNSDNSDNIPNNSIELIIKDFQTDNLWLSTRKGLVYFDRVHQKFETVLSGEIQDSLTGSININGLSFDDKGRLWIANFNGIYIWDNHQKTLQKVSLEKVIAEDGNQNIYCLFNDHKGNMWAGTHAGLLKINTSDTSVTLYNEQNKMVDVVTIMQDSENGFWVGSNSAGLFYFESGIEKGITRVFSKENGDFSINRVHGIIEDDPGIYYFLVRDGGLYQFNKAKNLLTQLKPDLYNPYSINSTAVITGFKSSNGIVWIGTYNSGVNYIDKQAKKFMHFKVNFKDDGLFNNNIRALCEDSEGYIWVGTKENGGISRFDPRAGTFKNYRKQNGSGKLNDDYIFSICEADRNNLLIGTFRKGLVKFNKKTGYFSYYTNNPDDSTSISDNRVYCIFKDITGIIWVGNYKDLQQFDPKRNKFIPYAYILRPRCFLDEGADKLWVGTKEHGLFLLDKTDGSFINLLNDPENPNSLSNNDIYALARDSRGNLWIGTKNGIARYNRKKNEFKVFTESDGLPSNWICGLLIDDNQDIWVSTSNGIARMSTITDKISTYDIIDGLQGNEFEGYVALKTHDGHMIFGGRNGFNYFKPDEIVDNTRIPPIVLTGFKIFNKEVPIGEKGSPLEKFIGFTNNITLKYNQSAITIDYAALNFTSPEKNKYEYKIEGLDKGWIEAGTNRSAVYTNIPPGNYIFKVKGSNNDNYWNETGRQLKITVLNPYWKTIWAYLVYLVILASIFYLIRRLLIFRIEQRNLLQFERIEKKKIEELNQMKLRFFTNISHEFRTPLSLISAPLNKLMSFKTNSDEQVYLYKIMKGNVQRMLSLVNELIDFRKAEQGSLRLRVAESDIVELLQQIAECFEVTAKERNIDYEFKYQVNSSENYCFDKRIIEKIIFNLLSNAFKFTPDRGKILVKLKVENLVATICVQDTGSGIPAEDITNIFNRFFQVDSGANKNEQGSGIGLAFSKRLIEVHHGKIEVNSQVGKGSEFCIEFSVDREKYSDNEQLKGKPEPMVLHELPDKIKADIADNEPDSKKNITLLVVEDNEELRQFLVHHFDSYNVLVAENGKLGFETANKKIPDIIVSDIMMPEMDGLEMCSKLKKHFATSHIPVILLTAKTEISQKIEGIDTGADAYIEKPFEIKYLESRIKNLLQQREVLRKRFKSESDTNMGNLVTSTYESKFIEKAQKIIEDNLDNPDFSIEDFGMELNLSRSQLFRKFKSVFELKPSEYIKNERLKHSRKLLLEHNFNINEISEMVGFRSASYFITSFKRLYGKTPAEFISESRNSGVN